MARWTCDSLSGRFVTTPVVLIEMDWSDQWSDRLADGSWLQNGKQGDVKPLTKANQEAMTSQAESK